MKQNSKRTHQLLCLAIAAVTALSLTFMMSGCGASGQDPESVDFFAMDTYMTVSAYDPDDSEVSAKDVIADAESEVNRLDKLLSTGRADSEISKLNASGSATLSEESTAMVAKALELNKDTGGKFDISIYPIMDDWGFTTKDYRVPDGSELAADLQLVDSSNINFDKSTGRISFAKDGMEIDLGGIAKGYTSAHLISMMADEGITSGLVNLGGNVQALGTKPDGSKWRVAVQKPVSDDEGGEEGYLGIIEIADMAVITSGGYERCFEDNGRKYHHIIDPDTGYPAESGVKSVTIVSPDGMLADGLSTSLFILGVDGATEFWHKHADEFDFIILDNDDKLHVTKGIADSFSSDDYEIEIVK